MEEEERRRKLEAGRAKLAEYRQRKAQSDGQKKQKKKKKQKGADPDEGSVQRDEDAPATEFSFSRTLRSGETVQHDQTYTIEPESEVSTTAEDYSSEVNGCVETSERSLEDEELHPPASPLEAESTSRLREVEDELAAKSLAVEELSQELKDIRAAFGADGVQQLQDFEAALKQRDGIITQLTANLQQARTEKDEVMREFLQLTEQSQKLQLQFQQLQAGESLRSSSISSTAADLLQSRQQVLIYQQQLEERDTQVRAQLMQVEERELEVKRLLRKLDERDAEVKGLQQELQEKDTQVKGLKERLLQTTELQLRLTQMETVQKDTEESLALMLQEKDLRIAEQDSWTSEQQQLLSQLQDNLRTSESQLAAKICELEACEVELQTSRQKERLSSSEILQLMGTVEELQKRYTHQGAEQGDAARKADQLRAELDEMYGQQIVQMKHELLARHMEEMASVRDQHSTEMNKVSEHLRAKLTQSTGEINALNARVVELQQKLQENQVLRERAEQDLVQVSKEKLLLHNQVQELVEDLCLTKQSKAMEKSQEEVQQELHAVISDLQAKLASVLKASSEMEAKHESEITNYQIKLEMLEREKDAVLDRMAESQEAELERLRTQLLFSHEEELSRLREDLHHESQMNMENLRDELRQVRNGYEAERGILDAERASLLQEIVLLKGDLSQALENSKVDELVSQLKELQIEIMELRRRESERSKFDEKESLDKIKVDNLELENKVLKEASAAVEEELKSVKKDHESLLRKIENLATDNQKANELAEDLKAEIERQKSTFSFAEKNFEVNFQELREELEERTRQYETSIQSLQEKLQIENQGNDCEPDEFSLVEKDTTELMEKLQMSQLEKVHLEETVQLKEVELQRMKADLKKVELEKAALLDHNHAELQRLEMEKARLVENMEKREAALQRMEKEKAELVKRLKETNLVSEKVEDVAPAQEKEEELFSLREEVKLIALRNKALEKELEEVKQRHLVEEGVCSIQDQHLQITALEEELQALNTSFRSAEQDRLAGLQQEEQSLVEVEEVHEGGEEVEAVPAEGLLAPPLAQSERERGPTAQRTPPPAADTHAHARSSAGTKVKITAVQSNGETEGQSVTGPPSMEGSDHEECRLQMEALRISLSQIHAAQLELLKESLEQGTASGGEPKFHTVKDSVSEERRTLVQMVCDDQAARSQDVHSTSPAGPSLHHMKEVEGDHSTRQELEEMLRLKLQEQLELQEQQHQQKIQRLRSYYNQQAQETEERYRTEIILLENRLQDLTGTDAVYSITAVSLPDQQGAELLQLDEADSMRRVSEAGTRDTVDLQRQREEDVAKVIVQMSVEFAQQTELARLGRQQNSDPERERLQEALTERNQELMLLRNRLQVLEQGAAEQNIEMDGEDEERSQREKIAHPSMQSSGIQTQMERGDEDEERDTMKEDVMSLQDMESSSDYITTERNLLRKANGKLRQVLVDVLKTTAATEETIGRHVEALLEASSREQQSATRDFSSESFHGGEMTTADDASVFSLKTETDEGLELSQMILGVGLQSEGAELQLEREEYLSSISSRLQSAVEKLLFTITETSNQLEHARVTQTELMREKFRHSEEIAELMRKQEELQERLAEEASARQRLALQLHSAEGLIDGYTGERRALEEQVRERAELQLQLEQELQVTSSRLQELELERQNVHHQRELLHRQQEAMRDEAGGRELRLVEAAGDAAPEADLLEETEKLMQEKVEVQRQAEKQHAELLQQVKQLEAELEEQVGRFAELEEAHRAENTDLTQQISALEKQLENNRRFLDEQAMDREHERDVFQQEIHDLEQQLKNPPKPPASSDQHHREVEELSSALREKADWCSELLLRSEQLQREVEERNEEIEKLEAHVRELEQALITSTNTLATEEDSKQYASMAGGEDPTLESLLQTEREALDRKEKEIVNLEEQLEQFREELQNKSEEVQQLHMQLEIQRKEINTQQQELLAHTNLHTEVEQKSELVLELEAQVEYLRGEQERLKRDSEEEAEQLNSVIEKLQQELSHIEHKQSSEDEEDRHSEEEDELKQKMDAVMKELDTLKADHSSLLVKYESLQQEVSHTETPEEVHQGEEEYEDLKQKMDTVVKELDTLKTDHSSLLVKYESLQQELSHKEHKQSPENEEHHHCEEEFNELKQKMDTVITELDTLKADHSSLLVKYESLQQEVSHTEHKETPEEDQHGEEEYEDLKQKMDTVLKELDTLKTEHSSLLVKYESLQQMAPERGETLENIGLKAALDEALRERTASLVVAQAQVQALQESAGSRVGDLMQRIAELEESVEEKEAELHSCRLQVEKAQEDAETLHLKVSQLEEKLREKVAAVLVSQAQLEAVQVQTKELHQEEATLDQAFTKPLVSRADLEGEGLTVARAPKTKLPAKVGFLTEKLQELEEGLSSLQKDQELQKELLSSSEEEVQEYERRLVVLMKLLNQMRTKPARPSTQVLSDGDSQVEEVLAELQKVRGEANAANEELTSCRELSWNLQEQIQLKEAVIQQLEEDLQKESERGEAAASKEELISCRELTLSLQEQIQEREMSIALLKDQLHRASGEVESSELLQELQEVRGKAEATKEELNSYIEQNLKLQEQIQVRDVSIAEMMDELQQLRAALSRSNEDQQAQSPPPPPRSPSPPLRSSSQSRKKAGTHRDGKGKDSSVPKDKPPLSRKNSNSQSSNGSQPISSGGVDAGTQVEQVEVSEELEEVIGEYTERIDQMQELHAAEIMDMENRHISESDNLKREKQRLEQECSALRATIGNLRTNEAVKLDHPSSSQFRDGYTSDSSSDWSHRTGFELPHLQAEFRSTPEGARREDPDALPDRIKTLLREVHQEGMQVLSLSELPETELPAAQLPLQAWRKEREALLDTVESLKTLITQVQSDTQTQDWRADLLGAVQQVFLRERQVLKVTLLTHLDQLDTRDAVVHLNQLQRLLTGQDAGHQEALSSLQSAERHSLLAEITHLRSQLQHLQQDMLLIQHPHPVASRETSGDWATGGEERERGGSGGERRGERGEPGLVMEELKTELAQTKLELEISLKNQNKYLQELDTLRAEVCVKGSKVDSLNDQLVEEQKRARELQWVMEREKNRVERREEGEREEVEDLRMALEEHRGQVSDLSGLLEEERKSSAQLRDRTAGEISNLSSSNTELQVQLDAQRLQVSELSSALQKEKELSSQLLRQLQPSSIDPQRSPQAISSHSVKQAEAGCSQVEEGVCSVETLLQSLQDQLTEKQSSLVDMMGQLEQQKLQEIQTKRAWEQQQGDLTRNLQGARESLEKLERHAQELQAQLDRERERGTRLEKERDGLQRRLTDLMDRSQRDSQQQTQWEVEGQAGDRTRDWVLQQKTEDTRTLTSSSTPVLDVAGQTAGQLAVPTNLDSVVSRLQLIANKINSMTGAAADRLPAEGPDSESLSWLHSNVQDVLSLLQQVPPVPPAVPASAALLTGGSSSALTERLLRQNAELTGFVSRLTEEKNELRNQLLRLEEELRRQRHLLAHSSSRTGSEGQDLVLFSGEREAWGRERARLEKSLLQAEAELSRLRGELRSETLRDLVSDPDATALKRMYGKYLRAESFRKALIYQKKYLLLLLGGFQECEEATLSLIARMGGRPSYTPLDSLGQRRRAFSRFRSAVRVSIALSRMRFLVRRWKKAAGGPISSPSINRNGLGQAAGIEGRNDSPYLQSSVEQYGERRGINRTGRDSLQHCTHHRYGTSVGEGGGGGSLCSHLQNYDPDRALTDYITRLEALQRRLGSVQSGSSSYAQLHFGIRR